MARIDNPGAHRIVVVGGGAGGLELATRLGNKLGKKGRAVVTLVDSTWTHMWKPLLHEVAAGTLDVHEDELEYLAQAHTHGFRFRLGRMCGLDREAREIAISATLDEDGAQVVPERRVPYDTLVLAVGSVSNDFGVTGVAEHCMFLDNTEQAEKFQRRLLSTFLRAHVHGGPQETSQLHVAIVGGGATGVELAAQLYAVTRALSAYGLDDVVPERDIRISLIEASPRILPALPERLSEATTEQLDRLGVKVLTGEQVVSVDEQGIKTGSGTFIAAGIRVWAAGIRAPSFLRDIAGLETNRINQLVVNETLQTTRDPNIFAIGDCAACHWKGHEGNVPPRAQAAHQQASCAARSIIEMLEGGKPKTFKYNDYGSLVSLGKYSTVGSIMGNLLGKVNVEGAIARLFYLSLYKMHQAALFGLPRVVFLTIANLFRRAVHPQIKLH
ncbi:MAG: NAD(P)/FAD-dependent oxidoreductase [Proteobacteria bacterium]|nr:MAG: NAD(P)/FAD-dependent oxidoreductase [Pseudomonadota bacterium]